MEILSPICLNSQAINTNNPVILKTQIQAHRQLTELKDIVKSIPNEDILLSTLTLQETKDVPK